MNASIILIVSACVFLAIGVPVAFALGLATAATQIPFGYIYAAMPVGGVLLVVHWCLIVKRYVLAREFASDAHFDATASASL